MGKKESVLAMSDRERERAYQMRRIETKQALQRQVATELCLSERQVRRLYHRWCERGDKGLISGHRGKISNRRRDEAHSSFVSWYGGLRTTGRYRPSHACDCFEEETGLTISKESARQWLIGAGYWQAKHQKAASVHPPRLRRARRGELVQIDGSLHNWLGQWQWALIEFVDDATSEVLAAAFAPVENTFAYFGVLSSSIRRHGLPRVIYSDRHAALFARPLSDGRIVATVFGRALEKLEIEHIPSSSAQGRGRVERAHGTAQDRVVKEMANRVNTNGLDEAAAMAAANAYLAQWCVHRNHRFAVSPRDNRDAHRACPYDETQLRYILSIWHKRKLSKNATFSYAGKLYAVSAGLGQWRLKHRPTIDICQHSDEAMSVLFNNRLLTIECVGDNERQQQAVGSKELNHEVQQHLIKRKTWKPPMSHPFKAASYQAQIARRQS